MRPNTVSSCELMMLKCNNNDFMQMRAVSVTNKTFDFSGWHSDSEHYTVTETVHSYALRNMWFAYSQ